MASAVKYQQFSEDLLSGVHILFGTTHTLKMMLSNTAPDVATHKVRADATEIAGGNGYTSGGVDIENDATRTAGTVTMTAVDKAITASGGSVGPFRYIIMYNDTPTSPTDPLISYWDLGAPVTLNAGDTLNIDFGASLATFA